MNSRLAWNNRLQRVISPTKKKSVNNKKTFLIVISLAFIATFLFLFSPNKNIIPIAFLSINSFFAVQIVCRECRPKIDNYLVPFNLAYLFFLIQLVIAPLTISYWGTTPGNLPWLPSTESMNTGLAIYSLAYVSFALSFEFFSRRKRHKDSQQGKNRLRSVTIYPRIPIVILGVAYVIIGLVGLYFFFGTIGNLVTYLNSPIYRYTLTVSHSGTLFGALSGFFRPFLSFGIVLLWSFWIDKYRMRTNGVILALGTGIALAGEVVSGLAFSYNRASFLVPLLSLMAAFYHRSRRLSSLGLIFLALISAGYISFIGTYRNIDNPNYRGTSLLNTVQIYGAAPQFLGLFLEETGFGHELYWGSTLVASALYPIPVIGKEFRQNSGVNLYNSLIYRNSMTIDSILPLQGELFANFHLVGVAIGYILIGYVVCRLDQAFRKSRNSFESYSWFVISYWFCYMVLGSLAILTQQLIGAFWPFYIYSILKFVNRKSTIRGRSI